MEKISPTLQMLLITAPLEIAVAFLRLILLLVLFPIILCIWIFEKLKKLFELETLFPEESGEACPPLPESIIRRPDPCIYSQAALHAEALPFTMVNPDISYVETAQPAELNPPLSPNTDYVVTVRVHNASTDPAIGVRLGLVAFTGAAFAFIGPTLTPLEDLDIRGPEFFQFLDVGPLGSATATFNWRTPAADLPTGLRATVSHPADTNTGNNLGIHSVVHASSNPGHIAPGAKFKMGIPLSNPFRHETKFRLSANTYSINADESVELRLVTSRGTVRRSLSARLANIEPHFGAKRAVSGPVEKRMGSPGPFAWKARPDVEVVKARYVGFEELKSRIQKRDYSLPDGYRLDVPDADETGAILMKPGEKRTIQLEVVTPESATPGTQVPINIVATTANGILAGGMTILFNFVGVE